MCRVNQIKHAAEANVFPLILQWAEHHVALSRLAVGQTLMVNQLVDMEWKFGGETEQTPLQRPPHHHQYMFISIAVSQALAQLVSLCYSLFWFGLRRHRLTTAVSYSFELKTSSD